MNILLENQLKKEQEARIKYNPDNIFKNQNEKYNVKISQTEESKDLKESFLKRILKKYKG